MAVRPSLFDHDRNYVPPSEVGELIVGRQFDDRVRGHDERMDYPHDYFGARREIVGGLEQSVPHSLIEYFYRRVDRRDQEPARACGQSGKGTLRFEAYQPTEERMTPHVPNDCREYRRDPVVNGLSGGSRRGETLEGALRLAADHRLHNVVSRADSTVDGDTLDTGASGDVFDGRPPDANLLELLQRSIDDAFRRRILGRIGVH